MSNYNKILHQIHVSETLERLISGKVAIPILDDFNPPHQRWYPHPPCLIPLFLGYGASYKGIVHHFFCDRKDTFCEYSLENGYLTEEARNENQLYTTMILQMIVVNDEISDDIIRFCKEINYSQLEKIDDFFQKYGDNIEEYYKELVYYNVDTPFVYLKNVNEYNGDFPSSLSVLNLIELNNSCSVEIPDKNLLSNIDAPIWMNDDVNKKDLFNDFVSKGQLKESWLTLNSKGWKLDEIAESLWILKEKNNDQLFHLIADNWISNWQENQKPTPNVKRKFSDLWGQIFFKRKP